MEIVLTFEPLTEEALVILRQLERVHLVRAHEGVNSKPRPTELVWPEPVDPTVDFSKLIGSISKETGEHMQREVEEMRNEWDRGF